MVQPYPSRGKPLAEAPRPPAPPSVVNAVKLMYIGAAVSTVSLIVAFIDISGTKAAIKRARPDLTATQVNQLNTFIITLAIVSGRHDMAALAARFDRVLQAAGIRVTPRA